ncbi:Uncharacterised protein [Mycobacterium tuberculosis]|uniref:Uncharacterized protein n=1 Tax=Mycobacterium tuberculosis TaxID=1773 RepID=A0A0T7LFE0_MYCTX|nr:Uncharacterised protein [Mycobacterium tuberculosis]CFE39347.1 Uncharacterised protein [Mycobacterium tuberculosis]CFR39458.1 Uncharacterised protein [Mycobacterium tuberculosis]CFS23306.1 Uncharacterised protein [Mycobacterium tuberculosis]CKQ77519.1 Uncharacterised protein [Mycobacterium tuberculosis]
MAVAPAAHDEAHHDAANVAPPPATLQGPIWPAQGFDHLRDRRLGLPVEVEHPLRCEVTLHLFPDDVSQILLRDIRPNPKRDREINQV